MPANNRTNQLQRQPAFFVAPKPCNAARTNLNVGLGCWPWKRWMGLGLNSCLLCALLSGIPVSAWCLDVLLGGCFTRGWYVIVYKVADALLLGYFLAG